MNNPITENGFLRLEQIIGNKKKGIPALIPVSRSTFWSGIKKGIFPKSIKLTTRCTVWKAAEILALIENAANGEI